MLKRSMFKKCRSVVLFSGAIAVVASALVAANGGAADAQDDPYAPKFNDEAELILPEGWREWVFIGSIVTPNALNGGDAPFPEFHMTYIDPISWEHWKKTGEFREGTMIAKELSRVYPDGANENGSTDQISGTGYFQGDFSGFEIALKSKKHYPDEPGNWAYFTFGHQPEPYNQTTSAAPSEACNACHEAAAADDFVFSQFYPALRAAKPN